MTINKMNDDAEIKRLINKLVRAIEAGDLEGVKPVYAQDIISFDVQSQLQTEGAEAKLKNWVDAFALFQRPLNYEISNLELISGNDMAFGHGFARLSGTLKTGIRSSGFWVRITFCLRKINGSWFIVHDHVSAPLDFESGKAMLNLEP